MEHIRQFDWCSSGPEQNFLEECDMDNCVIERIIANRFHDPMISSESEEEDAWSRPSMDWNKIFKRKETTGSGIYNVHVTGFRPVPPHPKLSALDIDQHQQCLKIICDKNPRVLPGLSLPKPKNYDWKVFEEVKETYMKEQKEYLEWAKTLWHNSHNIRALRPKPASENIYEAEFKMRAKSLESFPKNYEMAAHISLTNEANKCDMVFKEDLVKVNVANLPVVDITEPMSKKFSIFSPCPVPEPCNKHPCWFTLPNETEMSVLPLTELNLALSEFAGSSGASVVASERALICLLHSDDDWTIPVSVCEVIAADGEKKNVLVLGSDFSTKKKPAIFRTYKAFRHMLEYSLLPLPEQSKLLSRGVASTEVSKRSGNQRELESSDSDDDFLCNLIIDEDVNIEPSQPRKRRISARLSSQDKRNGGPSENDTTADVNKVETRNGDKIEPAKNGTKTKDFYTCTCNDSVFRNPPPRSFRKWQIRDTKTNDKFNMIVHCSHKIRGPTGREVIAEPIVEYQIDVGASEQSRDTVRGLALSLMLRRNASLLNVRVDYSGEIITIDVLDMKDLTDDTDGMKREISNILYESISQLSSLLPGHYILKHDHSHGENALLYASKVRRGDGDKFSLDFDCSVLADTDETKCLKTPPVLTDVLLPIHKYRKMLPCAFTPFPKMVGKEPRAPPARAPPPPLALQWPKKKNKKKKKFNKN